MQTKMWPALGLVAAAGILLFILFQKQFGQKNEVAVKNLDNTAASLPEEQQEKSGGSAVAVDMGNKGVNTTPGCPTSVSLRPIDYKVPFDCSILPEPYCHFCRLQQQQWQSQVKGDCNSLPQQFQEACRKMPPMDPVFGYGNCDQFTPEYGAMCRECQQLGPKHYWQCMFEKSRYVTPPKEYLANKDPVGNWGPANQVNLGGPRTYVHNIDWAQEAARKKYDPIDQSQALCPDRFNVDPMFSTYYNTMMQ